MHHNKNKNILKYCKNSDVFIDELKKKNGWGEYKQPSTLKEKYEQQSINIRETVVRVAPVIRKRKKKITTINFKKKRKLIDRDMQKQRKKKKQKEKLSIHKIFTTEELKTMPYSEYLQTLHWKRKRRMILKRDNYTCQTCGIMLGNQQLQVHHKTYERRGHEAPGDLITLCEKCHIEEHRQLKSMN